MFDRRFKIDVFKKNKPLEATLWIYILFHSNGVSHLILKPEYYSSKPDVDKNYLVSYVNIGLAVPGYSDLEITFG